MEKFTQKYSLVTFLEKVDEGFEYPWTNWPLHVTIADVFAVPLGSAELINWLGGLLEKQPSATATAAEDAFFGPDKQAHVTLLDMSKELIMLHREAIAALKDAGAVFNDPQYIEDGYRAHAAVQTHSRLHKDDPVTIAEVSLVDMFPGNDGYQRKVLKTFKLALPRSLV